MARNMISFCALWSDGSTFGFFYNNASILVYKDSTLYFKSNPCNDVYHFAIGVRKNDKLILNVGWTNLDKSCQWHFHLSHINKKRITKFQSDGILEPFKLELDGDCESCLLRKMIKAPFTGNCKRGTDLLDIIHLDVCGPF